MKGNSIIDILEDMVSRKDTEGIISYCNAHMKGKPSPYEMLILLEYLVSAYWGEKEYGEICELTDEITDVVCTFHDQKEVGTTSILYKMLAYNMMSAIIIGNDEVVSLLAGNNLSSAIEGAFANHDVGPWMIEALNIYNIDPIRNGLIKRIVPPKYANKIDLGKFGDGNYSFSQEVVERNDGLEEFIAKCDEVGFLDLRQEVLDFPPEFFRGETRDGFYIEPLMKNAWAANIEVLHKIDVLCQALDIPYFVNWGTMLGTVRHHGFIPWDDDIDIGVLRRDYAKLRYAIEHCQDELQFFDVYDDPEWGFHASKIANALSFQTNRNTIKRYHGFAFVASIDVFVIDSVPRDKRLEKEQYDAIKTIAEVIHLREDMEQYAPDSKEAAYGKKIEKSVVDVLKKMCHVEFESENPSTQELHILKEEILSIYSEEQSDYYTVPHRLCNGQDYYIPKEVFDGRIRMPFENIEVNVPTGYDFILRKNYGDNYMTPINRGGGHNYPFYGVLIDVLAEHRKNESREQTMEYIKNISYGYYEKFLHQTDDARLQFEDSYFKPEVIDGMEITEDVKRIHAAELEVLEEIKRICKKKEIKYFAIVDTILGAKNYKGYTPTSEGIHLGMKRDDYITFMNCLGEELDSWFNYESIYLDDTHEDMRSYITTDAFLVKDEDYLARFHGCTEIVGIDVSPIDAVDPNVSLDGMRLNIYRTLLKMASAVPTKGPYSDEVLGLVAEWKDQLNLTISTEGNLRRNLLKAADELVSAYREDSEFVRISPDLQVGIEKQYQTALFDDVVELPFENTVIAVPSGYEQLA